MRLIAQYGYRLLAAFYLLALGLLFALTPGSGTTWGAALRAWGVVAGAVFLGWLAGRESAKEPGHE